MSVSKWKKDGVSIVEKKTARKTLDNMKPNPENESPRRSWIYIFIAVLIIFGITSIFQDWNEMSDNAIDPDNFEQLKDQVIELRNEVESLELRIEELEGLE